MEMLAIINQSFLCIPLTRWPSNTQKKTPCSHISQISLIIVLICEIQMRVKRVFLRDKIIYTTSEIVFSFNISLPSNTFVRSCVIIIFCDCVLQQFFFFFYVMPMSFGNAEWRLPKGKTCEMRTIHCCAALMATSYTLHTWSFDWWMMMTPQ